MCGRYTLTSTEGLAEELGLAVQPPALPARYNIAPTQIAPIVANRQRSERALGQARWGLVPRWARDPAIGNKLINARAETVAEKPAFRDAFRRRRCLVVADGFYEWKREDGGKTPFYVRRISRRPMAFAGLWERWQAPDGSPLFTFTIVTTAANELIAPIHDRMPVIIEPAAYDRWLDPEPRGPEALADLLEPPPAKGLEAYEVSPLVNSPRNDTAACIRPVAAGAQSAH